MKHLFPLTIFLLLFNYIGQSQAVSPYTTCPDVNIAIARAGTNATTTNPYFLYNVNQITGVMTLVPGAGFKDPAAPTTNLQVNGIGVNTKDGYIYGLGFDGTTSTGRFVRLDKNYGVTSFGNIAPPTSLTGLMSYVNSQAGDLDTAGNYFLTAYTANATATVPMLDKFFVGRISNVSALTTGPPAVVYSEVDLSAANCAGFVSVLTSDPSTNGLKDFSYSAFSKSFFTYVTFKPAGAVNFTGQLIEIKPIAGSSPLKYQLICSPVTNSHTAEVQGTLIDKVGRFDVLFADGSFGVLNMNSVGNYDGTYTQIATATTTGLPNPLRGDMASCGQRIYPGPARSPFTGCPDVNIAVVRAGTNADTQNPYYIYNVNTTTGAPTLIPGGPLVYPSMPTVNLQINGVGINKVDGYGYGLVYEGTVTTAKFARFDRNYGVTLFSNIPSPSSPTGFLGFVNTAAGDVDRMNNYYFIGNTANQTGPTTFALDKLFLGVIPNLSTLTDPPNPTYYEIDVSDVNCSAFVSSLSTDPNDSGIKDFSFSPFTNTFFSYFTYKNPGATTFSGQLIEIKPIPGSSPLKYKLVCNPFINTNTAETAGTLIDKAGNFLVLLTDGTMKKMQSGASPYVYTGVQLALNNATGLPAVIRGDMASCGDVSAGPLPVTLNSFTGSAANCKIKFNWSVENQLMKSYELDQSFDYVNFSPVANIEANSASKSTYFYTIPATGRRANYRLRMTDIYGRISYSQIVSIEDACSKSASIVINPNPVINALNINWSRISASTYKINIYNAYGVNLYSSTNQLPEGSSSSHINVTSLPAGTYFMKVTDVRSNVSWQEKFVKQ